MTTNRPVGSQPGEPDLPTAAAVLRITAEPTKGWSAVANVPPADAHFLIATFGIMWSIATSTAGVMLVYRFAPYLAVAEVALGLAAIAAIALCGRGSRTIAHPAPTAEETAIAPRQAGQPEIAAGTKRGTSRPQWRRDAVTRLGRARRDLEQANNLALTRLGVLEDQVQTSLRLRVDELVQGDGPVHDVGLG